MKIGRLVLVLVMCVVPHDAESQHDRPPIPGCHTIAVSSEIGDLTTGELESSLWNNPAFDGFETISYLGPVTADVQLTAKTNSDHDLLLIATVLQTKQTYRSTTRLPIGDVAASAAREAAILLRRACAPMSPSAHSQPIQWADSPSPTTQERQQIQSLRNVTIESQTQSVDPGRFAEALQATVGGKLQTFSADNKRLHDGTIRVSEERGLIYRFVISRADEPLYRGAAVSLSPTDATQRLVSALRGMFVPPVNQAPGNQRSGAWKIKVWGSSVAPPGTELVLRLSRGQVSFVDRGRVVLTFGAKRLLDVRMDKSAVLFNEDDWEQLGTKGGASPEAGAALFALGTTALIVDFAARNFVNATFEQHLLSIAWSEDGQLKTGYFTTAGRHRSQLLHALSPQGSEGKAAVQ